MKTNLKKKKNLEKKKLCPEDSFREEFGKENHQKKLMSDFKPPKKNKKKQATNKVNFHTLGPESKVVHIKGVKDYNGEDTDMNKAIAWLCREVDVESFNIKEKSVDVKTKNKKHNIPEMLYGFRVLITILD